MIKKGIVEMTTYGTHHLGKTQNHCCHHRMGLRETLV
jgi:hypothetical protein